MFGVAASGKCHVRFAVGIVPQLTIVGAGGENIALWHAWALAIFSRNICLLLHSAVRRFRRADKACGLRFVPTLCERVGGIPTLRPVKRRRDDFDIEGANGRRMLCDCVGIRRTGGVVVRPYDNAAPSKRAPISLRCCFSAPRACRGHVSRRELRSCVRSFFPLTNKDDCRGSRLDFILIVDRTFSRPRLPSPFAQRPIRMAAERARTKLFTG